MARLNLTLDADTFAMLERDARRERTRVATLARRILREAVERRRREERWDAWEEAYRRDRADARQIAREWEPGVLEVAGDEAD